MPRGNKAGNTSKSPFIENGNVSATPAEISNLADYALHVFTADTPDLHSVEETRAAIITYFENCAQHGIRPANLGLYASLGLSRQDFNNIITGKSKSRVNPACIDVLKKAARAVGVYREGLAMTGKINPVTYIFMGKNYDGLSDTQTLEVTANHDNTPKLSPEEIQKQIEQDIPIDTNYTELSDNS